MTTDQNRRESKSVFYEHDGDGSMTFGRHYVKALVVRRDQFGDHFEAAFPYVRHAFDYLLTFDPKPWTRDKFHAVDPYTGCDIAATTSHGHAILAALERHDREGGSRS